RNHYCQRRRSHLAPPLRAGNLADAKLTPAPAQHPGLVFSDSPAGAATTYLRTTVRSCSFEQSSPVPVALWPITLTRIQHIEAVGHGIPPPEHQGAYPSDDASSRVPPSTRRRPERGGF